MTDSKKNYLYIYDSMIIHLVVKMPILSNINIQKSIYSQAYTERTGQASQKSQSMEHKADSRYACKT